MKMKREEEQKMAEVCSVGGTDVEMDVSNTKTENLLDFLKYDSTTVSEMGQLYYDYTKIVHYRRILQTDSVTR